MVKGHRKRNRSSAIYETGVDTNWLFATFKPPYLGDGASLLLIANIVSRILTLN